MNKNSVYPFWFLLIPFFFYVVFFLFPSLMGAFFSFTDWNIRSRGNIHFIGIQNFVEIFTSRTNYAMGIFNTLKFTVISNIVKIIPAFFLAVLLQQGMRGKDVYRTILYIPAILPYLVIGLIFKSILNSQTGLLNAAFGFFRLEMLQQKWLSDLNVVWKSIYLVDGWRGIGYVMTIFLAGLNAIPNSYYEAADIDGANFFLQLRHITLPMLTGAFTINIVFGLTYGLKVFDIVYVLTNGGPGHATEVLTTYAYKLYACGQYGMAAAMNTLLFILAVAVGIFVVTKMNRKEIQL